MRAAWAIGWGWALLVSEGGATGRGTANAATVEAIPGATERIVGSQAGIVAMNSGALRVFTPAGVLIRRLWGTGTRDGAWTGQHRAGRRKARNTDGVAAFTEGASDGSTDPALPIGTLSIASAAQGELADPEATDAVDLADIDGEATSMTQSPSAHERLGAPNLGDAEIDMDMDVDIEGETTLAAGGHHAWIGRTDGLWRVGLDDGELVRGALGRQGITGVAVSPDGKFVAAVASGRLVRSSNGGDTWSELTATSGRLTGIATSAAGDVLFWDDRGPRLAHGGGTRVDSIEALLPARVSDVIACGDHFAVVAMDRFIDFDPRLKEASRSSVGLPRGATRVFCLEHDARVSYGSGVWTSLDRGRHWTPRATPAVGTIRTMAQSTGRLWFGTAAGIWSLPIAALATPTGATVARSALEGPLRPPAPSQSQSTDDAASTRRAASPGLWRLVLPQISMSFAAWRARDHLSAVGLVTATFPLDPSVAIERPRRDRVNRASERRRLDWIEADARAAVRGGKTAAEEAQAISRIVGEGKGDENAARSWAVSRSRGLP